MYFKRTIFFIQNDSSEVFFVCFFLFFLKLFLNMYKQTNTHKHTLTYTHAYYELTRKSVIKSHTIILCYWVTCFN